MGYDRLEDAGLDELDQEVDRSARDPEVLYDSFFLEVGQRLHGAAGRHHVLERLASGLVEVLGVVQVHELQPVQPQQPQAPLDRAAHLVS